MGARTTICLLGVLALGPGCLTDGVRLTGAMTTVASITSSESLTFDYYGFPRIDHRPVDLPRGQEDVHYGVVVVDTRPLPAAWHPRHTPRGGILVSLVDLASPLAIAGLRPYDQVLRANGEPVTDAPRLGRLLQVEPRIRLVVRGPDGTTRTIEAEGVERVNDETSVSIIPDLLLIQSSHTGTAFSLAGMFTACSQLEYANEKSSYQETFELGFLFNLFFYERVRDPRTGVERSRFRLFGFLSFGDDL